MSRHSRYVALYLAIVLLIPLSGFAANNPDITVDMDLGGADTILVGRTGTLTANLKWPPGDFDKPVGSYLWIPTDGVTIDAGQGTSTVTIKGAISELAKVKVTWTAEGFDSPTAEKQIKVIGIGLGVWGSIASFTGDLYDSGGNTFIPPGGSGVLVADASDQDKVAGVYVSDSFNAYDAFGWSASHGSATGNGNKTCSYTAPSVPVRDAIELKVKDDGVFFPDRETATYQDTRLVYVYELTGLEVSGATPEQRFTDANFVKLVLKEKFPGIRPTIRYEAVDQNGEVVLSEKTTLGEYLWKIPKPGRFTFKVTNDGRAVETFASPEYTYFTLTLSDKAKTFNWEKDQLLYGMDSVIAKRLEVENAVKEWLSLGVGVTANAIQLTEAWSEATSNASAYAVTADTDISANEAKLSNLEAQWTLVEWKVRADKFVLDNATDDLAKAVAQSADQATIDRLTTDVARATVDYVESQLQLGALDQKIADVKSALDTVRAARRAALDIVGYLSTAKSTAGSFAGPATWLKNLKAGYGGWAVLDIIGIAFNIDTIIEKGPILDKYIQAWRDAESLQAEYNELVKALIAGRKDGPLGDAFSVTSDPPSIQFNFTGSPNWRTSDDAFIDKGAVHLVALNGNFTNWDTVQNTGSSGVLKYAILAYGNLGNENVYIDKDTSQQLALKSGNLTEDQAISLVQPLIDAEKAPEEILKASVDGGAAILDTVLTICATFVAWTLVGLVVLKAVQLAVALLNKGVQALIDWLLGGSELEKTLKALFPK